MTTTTRKRETSRQEALRLIAEADADWEQGDGDGLMGSTWTPEGQVWVATDCHLLTVNYYTDRPAGWIDLLEDLRLGTRPCETPDCEGCG